MYSTDTEKRCGRHWVGWPLILISGMRLDQGLGQAIFESLNPGQAFGHLETGRLRGRAHAHDADEVFGAGPALVLLEAAVDEGPDGRALADVEGADPGGP